MKDRNSSYPVKIGNTTFIVCVKQSESAKKDLDTVFQDICKHETLGDFFTGKSFNLENPQKVCMTNSAPKVIVMHTKKPDQICD